HSCHCVRRPEHHPPSRSNRVRRRVRDKPATQHRRSPGSRETGASSGGRNPAEQHPFPFHPSGSPSPPRAIQNKLLIAISESRKSRRNSVHYPVNAGSTNFSHYFALFCFYISYRDFESCHFYFRVLTYRCHHCIHKECYINCSWCNNRTVCKGQSACGLVGLVDNNILLDYCNFSNPNVDGIIGL